MHNESEELGKSVQAVFDCGSSFSRAKVLDVDDDYNLQNLLSTQRTNLRDLYSSRLPNEIGQTLGNEPFYADESKQLLVSHIKQIALEDLIEKQDLANRYTMEETQQVILDEENEHENQGKSNDNANRYPTPRPW